MIFRIDTTFIGKKEDDLKPLIEKVVERAGFIMGKDFNCPIPSLAMNPYKKALWTLPLHKALTQNDEYVKPELIRAAFSNVEIYVPGLEAVFGESDPEGHTVILSLARLRADRKKEKLEDRLLKLLLHETGHLFGLEHCDVQGCPMGKNTGLRDLDGKNCFYCEECEKKTDEAKKMGLPQKRKPFSNLPVIVHSPGYYADIGQHVFPVEKYGVLFQKIKDEGLFPLNSILTPKPASWEELEPILEAEYIMDLSKAEVTERTFSSELPVRGEIIDAFRLTCGGTHLAAVEALKAGAAFNISGGFHHGFPDHAEGFCYINDVAYALIKLKEAGLIRKAAVIDLDVHQGNGTAVYFKDDPDVFTMSVHQENNYPKKEKSDLDVGLEDRAGDEEYLARLRRTVPSILEFHKPEIVIYLAGGDPFRGDQLGGLSLSKNGLLERDQLVIRECRNRNIPLAVVPAGGYAHSFEDTVEIHLNTVRAFAASFVQGDFLSQSFS